MQIAWERDLPVFELRQPGAAETLARYARFYLVTSLLWDTVGAVGNLALLVLAGRPLLAALERFRRRAHVIWVPA